MASAAPNPEEYTLIHVEDSEVDYEIIQAQLAGDGFVARAQRVETATELQAALATGPVDAVLADHFLPEFDSLAALAIVRAADPDLPFVIVSGAIGEEIAVEAMRAGATDYLLKDRLSRLVPALRQAIDAAAGRRARREAETALIDSEARYRALSTELRALSAHLTRVREDEREHLAREIHDDVGSSLTAVKFGLASLRNALDLPAGLMERVREIEQIVDGVVATTSRIVHDLRPGIVDEGIVPALDWLVRSFGPRVGIATRFLALPPDLELPRDVSIAVFRVCQEALNNAAKHSGASRIDVRIELAGGSLALEVRDNGTGIPPAALDHATGWGLRGMRERAASLGGELDVSASSGGGATITLLLPELASDSPPEIAETPS